MIEVELTLHGVRNNTEVAWTVLRLKVTDMHMHAHDIPNPVCPPVGGGSRQSQ
jgi:hypothetical protein